jgi:hypothetical protein
MKKSILFLSFAFFAISVIAQSSSMPSNASAGFGSQFAVTNGQGVIDGKNSSSAIYAYTGADSLWTASFANMNDKEGVVIMYTKTITSPCVITFPSDVVIKQPVNMPGVAFSGTRFQLNSVANGSFQIVVQYKDGKYTVVVTRTSMQ